MAIKQARTVGVNLDPYNYVLNCALLKEEYLQDAFYSTSENPLWWTDGSNLVPVINYYISTGDNIDRFLLPEINRFYAYRNNPFGAYVLLAQLTENEFFCMNFSSGDNVFAVNFCITDEPKTGMKTLVNFQDSVISYLRRGTFYDSWISILVDDVLEELNIVFYHWYNHNSADISGVLNASQRKVAYQYLRDFLDIVSNDPWIDGGESGTGGGNGSLNISSDTISLGSFPTSAINTGFLQAFSPSLGEVQNLSAYMWDDGFLNQLSRFWSDPMSIIISLTHFPFFIPSTTSKIVQAGNVTTNVRMRVPDSQYVTLDCGKITIDRFYDAYVDFEPYTQCEIFLPYIGTHKLSMDDISGKEINPIYTFDVLSGVCVCNIYVNGSIMYTFTGNCGISIPITSQSYADTVKNTLNVGLSTVLGSNFTSTVTNLAGAVMSAKPHIERCGQIGGNGGLFSPQKPFLTFSIPRVCIPKNQNVFIGYPSFIETKLSKLNGFTRVFDVHLSGMTCTETEYNQIVSLLKEGVII